MKMRERMERAKNQGATTVALYTDTGWNVENMEIDQVLSILAERDALAARVAALEGAARAAWAALLDRVPGSVPGGEEACETLRAALEDPRHDA